MGKEEYNDDIGLFKDMFDRGLGALAVRYGIELLYIGDSLLDYIGFCSLYLPLDIREEEEKYKKDFDRAIFDIDGSIIEGAQFNSCLLTRKEVEAFVKNIDIKLNLDSSALRKKDLKNGKIVYEAIAVNEPNLDNLENRII